MAAGNFVINVFRQDAFSGLTLTEMVEKKPYVPDTLGKLNIFEDDPIVTTDVQIESEQRILSLVKTTPRGAPIEQRTTEKRAARYFRCPRLAKETTIYANELQNVRRESEEVTLKDLASEVAIRLTGPSGLTMQLEYTEEFHRLGAVQGILLDSDGSTLFNWYNEFGIAQPAEIAFNLAANTAGTLIPICNTVRRGMKRAGQGAFLEGRTEVHALCGDSFFDVFTQHPDVIRTYQNWAAVVGGTADGAPELRRAREFETFFFGGIYWHNYRGSDDNSTIAIPPTKVKFFPVNAPGVFRRALAPAEGFSEINQRGRPIYIFRNIDPSEEVKWVQFTAKKYPLHICTRPEMLQRGTA